MTTPGNKSIFQCELQTAERTAAAEPSKAPLSTSPVPAALPQQHSFTRPPAGSARLCCALHHAQPQPAPHHHHHVGPDVGLKPYDFCMGRCEKAKSHRMPDLPLTVRTASPVRAARHLLGGDSQRSPTTSPTSNLHTEQSSPSHPI